ncbi:hypothetical protein [Pseudoduganella aquatica]|jgi:hypothetical protein|uniref:hypothetical protein n=1 Tax=Pseudoduganella aquatica TaxID=2660641 RepID=UPI001E5D3173|nr:hypothetical protein [Pseudoduganella aquatica]
MRDVILNVTFDIDQDTQLLRWNFEADGKPIAGQGVETGLLAFQLADKLSVNVIAECKSSEYTADVHIDGCHFITIPRAFTKRENPERAGEFPEASPFNDYGAVISLGSGDCVGHPPTTVKLWQPDLPMQCDNLGRWELSMVLTTTITRNQGGLTHREQRVFAFDPECEVGMGT